MLLLPDGVSLFEVPRDFGVEVGFFVNAQIMRVASRIERFDFVKTSIVDLARQDEMTKQM
jgi:hypothetical protein